MHYALQSRFSSMVVLYSIGRAPHVGRQITRNRPVMMARQAIVDFVEAERANGSPACGIVLSPEIVTVVPTRMRIFQGWRYLEVADVPIDIGTDKDENMPSEFLAELELGIF